MKRWVFPIICAIILGSLIAWRLGLNHAAAVADDQQRQQRQHAKALVNVATASYKDILTTFEAVGNVDSPYSVDIAPKYAGPVTWIGVREGDHVTAGEVLARMDPSEAEANVAQQEANVAQAQQHLAQAQLTQGATDVGVQSTIREASAGVYNSEANFDESERNYVGQVGSAESTVTDNEAKLAEAVAGVASAQAGVRSAQANLNDAQVKYDGDASLLKQGFIAAQTVDDALAALDVAKANLDTANSQLNSANSAQASADAELKSAEQQLDVTKTTGTATIAAARAELSEAKATLQTAVANTSQQPAYEANLRALQAAVVAAQAELHDAQVVAGEDVLITPISGYVVARLMDPGAQATAGEEVLQVQAEQQVWVTVPVPEEEADHIYDGQEAKVEVDGVDHHAFTGAVTQINASADPSSRQFSIRVTIPNPKDLIKPGMFATVHFVTGRLAHQIYVPREALNYTTGQPATAFVVNSDGTVEQRTVIVAASDADGFAISSGVQIGEQVVTLSSLPLKDGAAVRIAGSGGPGGSGGGHHRHHHADQA